MYIFLKNRKGGTLILVLLVMLVLMIFGVSLISLGYAETNHSTRQLNRTQAYFSARSGVEVGLERIKTEIDTGNYQDVATLYDAVKTQITGSVNPGLDTFIVNFIDDGGVLQDKIKIYAVGIAHDVQNTTAVTIQFTSPDHMPLDWVNPGQIIRSGFWEKTTGPVIVNTAKLLGHAPKKSSNSLTTWRAPSIHFIDDDDGFSLEVTHKELVFQSNLVTFNKKILTKDDNDYLILNTFNNLGFRDDSGNKLVYNNDVIAELIPDGWGVVVVKEGLVVGNKDYNTLNWAAGYYAIAPNTAISNASHRSDPTKVLKIINQATINFIEEVISRETELNFNPTQIKWSNN